MLKFNYCIADPANAITVAYSGPAGPDLGGMEERLSSQMPPHYEYDQRGSWGNRFNIINFSSLYHGVLCWGRRSKNALQLQAPRLIHRCC